MLTLPMPMPMPLPMPMSTYANACANARRPVCPSTPRSNELASEERERLPSRTQSKTQDRATPPDGWSAQIGDSGLQPRTRPLGPLIGGTSMRTRPTGANPQLLCCSLGRKGDCGDTSSALMNAESREWACVAVYWTPVIIKTMKFHGGHQHGMSRPKLLSRCASRKSCDSWQSCCGWTPHQGFSR